MSGSTLFKRPCFSSALSACSLSAIAFLLSLLVLSSASAEETAVFELSRTSSSQLSGTPLARMTSSDQQGESPAFAFRLPLPDSGEAVSISSVEDSRTVQPLSLLDAEGKVSAVLDVTSYRVTDFGSLYGVLVASADGVYATLVDRSAAEAHYYQIAPLFASGRSGGLLHSVTSLLGSELPSGREYGADGMRVPAALVQGSANLTIPESPVQNANGLAADGWRGIEMIAVAPSEFSAGVTDQQIIDQLTATVAAANVYFEPLKLIIDLVGVQIFHPGESDPYAAAVLAQDGMAMLKKAQDEWRNRNTPQHDLVSVFGRGRFKDVYGLAFTESSCEFPDFSVLFATQGGVSAAAELSLADTLAHEIGHFIGMEHDSQIYSDGPSLMWPIYVANPGGFSSGSVAQYQDWAGPGRAGGSCFGAVLPPAGKGGGPTSPGGSTGTEGSPVFEEGTNQSVSVAEGKQLIKSVHVRGDGRGVTYSASNLPAGASFDTLTGTLLYTPDFSVANRRKPKHIFKINVTAASATGSSSAVLLVTVRDVNRRPNFGDSLQSTILVNPGGQLHLVLRAKDPDRFDKLKVKFLSKDRFKSLRGRKSVTIKNGTVRLSWRVPADVKGAVRLRVRAEDERGASFTQTIAIQVENTFPVESTL